MAVIERVLGGPPPELKFFTHDRGRRSPGKTVRALRHGMAGQPGWELFGPWDDGEAVREAIVAAGEEFGMRQVGGRAYSSNTLESGWIPSPLPAVYSGDSLKAYREWLPAEGYEGSASIGGSFVSDDIEDYYFTPWDLGYGSYVKFDHDFVGRDALEQKADDEHRRKVTLALDDEDVTAHDRNDVRQDRPREVHRLAVGGLLDASLRPGDGRRRDGGRLHLDRLQRQRGQDAHAGGRSTPSTPSPGTEVTFVWGEEDGGSAKPTVEPHVQTEIRAVVSPVPYVEVVRTSYAPGGWRAAGA